MKQRPALIILFAALISLSGRALPAPVKPAAETAATPPAATPAELKKLQAGCDGGKGADCLALADKSRVAAQLALFEKACNLNNGEGCARQGMRLHVPLSGETRKDPEATQSLVKALKQFEQECIAGAESSCARFIKAYEDPAGLSFALESIQLDLSIALLAETKCKKNPPQDCDQAIKSYGEGRGVASDRQRVEELTEIACRSGDGIHCLQRYHQLFEKKSDPRGKQLALEYWQLALMLLEKECSRDHGESCNALVTNHGDAPDFYFDNKATESGMKAVHAYEKFCRAGDRKNCDEWLVRLKPIFAESNYEPPVEAGYLACLSGIPEYCKKELERLSKTLDDKEKKIIFTVEQFKAMGTRFFAINRAMRRHCRGGDLAFCLLALDTRLPDFEHVGLSDTREKLIASLLARRLRGACDKDDLETCEKLSEQYRLISEKAVNPDHLEKIAKLLDARCRTGNLTACTEFHARKLWQGLDADPARAEKYLEQSAGDAALPCERGATAACLDALESGFFLGAGRAEPEAAAERAAGAVLAQFESGKFCDGMSQSDCMDALYKALLSFDDGDAAWKQLDRLATGLPAMLKTGCEGGNGKACLLLAAITKEPLSADVEKNSDSPDAPAKNLILYLENAWALKPDPQQARALLEKGVRLLMDDCGRGQINGCLLAAQSAPAGEDESPDKPVPPVADPVDAAVDAGRKACTGGDAAACGRLGDFLATKGKPEALPLLQSGCAGGDSRGCLQLGRLAIEGRIPAEGEISAAARLFTAACEAKIGAGCRKTLKLRVSELQKAEPDDPKDFQLMEKGCEYGDLVSCYFYGTRLFRGKEDSGKGLLILQTSCEKGEAFSCNYLGSAYQYGSNGLTKDRPAARRYYQRACELGESRACDSMKDLDKPVELEKED